jgi:hypothetical protein
MSREGVGMPRALRMGLTLLAAGALADVIVHVTGVASGHAGVPAAVVHAVVAAGMVASLAGLVVTALRISAPSDDERRHA